MVKKFGDDSGGSLCALLAYYGLLSIFPLLLLLITLLGIFFSNDAGLQLRVIHSAVAQFPVVGQQLARPGGISSLRSRSDVGLVIGLAGLVWGGLGVAQVAQRAMADVWNVAYVERSAYWNRLARSLGMLGVVALDVVISTGLAGFVTVGGQSARATVAAVMLGLCVNAPLFVLGFRLVTPKVVSTRSLVRGRSAPPSDGAFSNTLAPGW